MHAARLDPQQRKAAEAARELVLRETQHRMKNTLATVLALADQTFKSALPSEHEVYFARIEALAEAHSLLTRGRWDRTTIRDTIERAVGPFVNGDRPSFAISGPDAELDAGKVLALTMVLHELGTNAIKYGALSDSRGTVSIVWESVGQSGHRAIHLTWREEGGPPVEPPSRKGFGSTLIEQAFSGTQGHAKLRYAPQGLICTVDMKL